jgi:hypothetical protein
MAALHLEVKWNFQAAGIARAPVLLRLTLESSRRILVRAVDPAALELPLTFPPGRATSSTRLALNAV